MDVKSKKLLSDKIEWAKFTGITCTGTDSIIPVTPLRAIPDRNSPHQMPIIKVDHHMLGTDQSKDILIYEDKENPQRLFGVGITEDERFLTLYISQRGSNGNALYYRDLKKRTEFKPITTTFDDDISVVDNIGDKLIISTNRKAPNQKV